MKLYYCHLKWCALFTLYFLIALLAIIPLVLWALVDIKGATLVLDWCVQHVKYMSLMKGAEIAALKGNDHAS